MPVAHDRADDVFGHVTAVAIQVGEQPLQGAALKGRMQNGVPAV
jgi:hypothetical protein